MFMLLKKMILIASLVLALVLTLPGCSTAPAKVKFPMPPNDLMVKPSEPIQLPEDRELLLSEIVGVTKNNNLISFETKSKLESLQDWVLEQSAIFNKSNLLP